MVRWYSLVGHWISVGLPYFVAMDRKLENGCKIQDACCEASGIMCRLAIVKPANETTQGAFDSEINTNAKTSVNTINNAKANTNKQSQTKPHPALTMALTQPQCSTLSNHGMFLCKLCLETPLFFCQYSSADKQTQPWLHWHCKTVYKIFSA